MANMHLTVILVCVLMLIIILYGTRISKLICMVVFQDQDGDDGERKGYRYDGR